MKKKTRLLLGALTTVALGAALAWFTSSPTRVLGYQVVFVVGSPAMRSWSMARLATEPEGAIALGAIAVAPAEPLLVREEAIRLLGSLKDRARLAAPKLVAGLAAKDPRIRRGAHGALAALTLPDESPRGLTRSLRDGAGLDSTIAALKLGEQFWPKRFGLTELRAALAEGAEPTRLAALSSLEMLGARSSPALPELLTLLQDRDETRRLLATEVLASIFRDGRGLRDEDAARSVRPLVRRLKDPSWRVRESAAYALRAIGLRARIPAPALLAATRDEAPRVRFAAAVVLARLAPDPRLTPILIEGLKDENRSSDALSALSDLGPEAAAAVPALRKFLVRSEGFETRYALTALDNIGPPASAAHPELMQVLDRAHTGTELWLDLPLRLWRIGPRPRVLAALRQRLKSPDPDLRYKAAAALARGSNGNQARAAVPDLIAALDDPSLSVREAAMEAIATLGPAAARSTPTLARRLSTSEGPQALEALGAIGPRAAAAIPAMSRALLEPELRTLAAAALARVDPAPAPEAALALIEKLYADDGDDPTLMARPFDLEKALRELGPRRTLPALLKLFRSDDADAIAAAAMAAAAFDEPPGELVEGLIKALRSSKTEAQNAAAESLRRLGPAAPAAIPELEDRLDDPDPEVQARASLALAFIEPPRKARDISFSYLAELNALGALARARQDPALAEEALLQYREATRGFADQPEPASLSRLGPSAPAFVAAIIAALSAEDAEDRAATIGLLAEIGPPARAAAPLLSELARTGDPAAQRAAIKALGALGHAEPLIALLETRGRPGLRAEVLSALRAAGPKARRAAPRVVSLLDKPEHRAAAALTLLAIDPATAAAIVPALIDLHSRAWASEIAAMTAAIKAPWPASARLVAPLIEALGDQEASRRWSAAELLFAIGPPAASAAPALAAAIAREPSIDARLAMIDALGATGAKSPEAIPALIEALDDKDEALRLTARRVLESIGAGDARAARALDRARRRSP